MFQTSRDTGWQAARTLSDMIEDTVESGVRNCRLHVTNVLRGKLSGCGRTHLLKGRLQLGQLRLCVRQLLLHLLKL